MNMVEDKELLRIYRTMLKIRMFEERVAREFRKGDMPGFVHSYIGAEAVSTGICMHLNDDDYISSTHRGHGHCIAKGCTFKDMLAELYGRETGLCKGRGGSMHIADFARGMLGANAIVGGGIALAAGGALAIQTRGEKGVAVTFFGDGACNQGILHETMNLASIWKLPLIFVCENNDWAESTPVSYSTSVTNISARASAYGFPGLTVDAADAIAVYQAAKEAVIRARNEQGPTLIEAKIGRMIGHYLGDPEGYRSKELKEEAKSKDPIPPFESMLIQNEILGKEDLLKTRQEIEKKLDDAVNYAKISPLPNGSAVEAEVYAA
ncbi:MAG TPA: pyruvate dehydrogenase (acetyl-transferring) E1 component subunit alpha [Gammaproteobacteria bacterium]|nr:pyruvate dehydrogenase (acetyl-transferring) E1 component subunit alpha [Gammaproteobacteria bacterium]|tara:strand:- start:304 stop:1269 length:966 start_codon:yes stop_codon:yes gene_type:complete